CASHTLLRGPDVRQAEEDLIAANALVGVAYANFFPRLSLTGLFGAVAPEIDNFFYPAGKTWSIAASLLGPLFQGGRIRAEYGVAYAQWEQTKAAYEAVVTGAFADIGKTWSIAASLLGPLFQGGRIRAEYGVAYAQWEQTKAAYEAVVTGAFA